MATGKVRQSISIAVRLIKISWKNILRQKRRSLLTISIMVLGCSGLMTIGGYFHNIIEGFRDQYIHSQTGHLQVSARGFFEKGVSDPFRYVLKDLSEVQKIMLRNRHVLYTVPRLNFGAMVNNNNTNVAVVALGVDPVSEAKMGRYKADHSKFSSTNIVEGEDLDLKDSKGVLVGKGLLKALGLKLGDSFSLLTSQKSGALEGAELRVRGVFQTVVKEFDDRAMKVPLETAQEVVAMSGEAHSLLAILDDTENTEMVQRELESDFRAANLEVEIVPWTENARYYHQAKDMLGKIFRTVQTIIAVIFLFSIANTLNMAIFERIREFGTMMAIGNSRGVVFSVIIFEALLLGLIGATLGLGAGWGAAKAISAIGIEMPPPPQGSYGYYAMITLYPRLVFETFAIAMGATLLSALVPAYKASRFRVIQALGYV